MKLLLVALMTASSAALAQAPRTDTPQGEPPDIARNMCDKLAGSERERCLAEQSRAPDEGKDRPAVGGNDNRRHCDDLLGPEKESCLKKGGRIKAGMGATRLTQ